MRPAVVAGDLPRAASQAFGRLLIEQPLMRNVLADLAIESEAATVLALRLARAYDATDPQAGAVSGGSPPPWPSTGSANADRGGRGRGTGVLGRQRLRRGFDHAAALSRVAAEFDLGRFRQRDLSGRAAGRRPTSQGASRPCWRRSSWVAAATGGSTRSRRPSRTNGNRWPSIRRRARRLVERLALALEASLVVRCSPPAVADAFCATRLAADWGRAFGTLPPEVDFDAIIERAMPQGVAG